MRRAFELGSFVVHEYYGLFDHGAIVTLGVDDENHFWFMNRQNVFLPKREEKMDATTHAGSLKTRKKEKKRMMLKKGKKWGKMNEKM